MRERRGDEVPADKQRRRDPPSPGKAHRTFCREDRNERHDRQQMPEADGDVDRHGDEKEGDDDGERLGHSPSAGLKPGPHLQPGPHHQRDHRQRHLHRKGDEKEVPPAVRTVAAEEVGGMAALLVRARDAQPFDDLLRRVEREGVDAPGNDDRGEGDEQKKTWRAGGLAGPRRRGRRRPTGPG